VRRTLALAVLPFLWGPATSGFQTEMGGSPSHADRGSDWWAWTHDAGLQAEGLVTADKPEDGPGSWARYRTDDRLARDVLHANAFRLGIEWSRVFPRPTTGATTLKELDALADRSALRHYRAVLRDVRRRGMTPFVTVNHFTLPLWIHDPLAVRAALKSVGPDDPLPASLPRASGWLTKRTIDEFAKYAGYLAWKLGDLVDYWTPVNEPNVVVTNGFVLPSFPPGVTSFTGASVALVNLERANAAAYVAIKRRDPGSQVGLVQNTIAFTGPATAVDHADRLYNRTMVDVAVKRRPRRADFIGVNYYFRGRVTPLGAPLSRQLPLLDFVPSLYYRTPQHPDRPPCPSTCSDFGNEISAAGFGKVLREMGRYRLPVYVTENGIADARDRRRPAFLRAHVAQVRSAMRAGVDVRGYFHWSLTDNFEWSEGYAPKFGLFDKDRHARPSARGFAALKVR
jgi:beta-galactosidase